VWAGVDSVWEQEKLEARKMLENAADSHTSGARCVGWLFGTPDSLPENQNHDLLDNILRRTLILVRAKKTYFASALTFQRLTTDRNQN
jgi:hypothetical protein